MKLDRNAVNTLLSLDDDQLRAVIRGLAARSGVSMDALHISENDIAGIRRALRMATDEDIARFVRGVLRDVSADDAKVRILLVPTNEELMIAMDTAALCQ